VLENLTNIHPGKKPVGRIPLKENRGYASKNCKKKTTLEKGRGKKAKKPRPENFWGRANFYYSQGWKRDCSLLGNGPSTPLVFSGKLLVARRETWECTIRKKGRSTENTWGAFGQGQPFRPGLKSVKGAKPRRGRRRERRNF